MGELESQAIKLPCIENRVVVLHLADAIFQVKSVAGRVSVNAERIRGAKMKS